jgi:type II secretory ATPase GspE/PulE/Tfp pilus assembly ATPase PilB-like protein
MSFSELRQYVIDPAAKDLIPLDYGLQRLVVVLGTPAKDEFTVGMVEPNEASLLAELRTMLGGRLTPIQLNAYEVRKALARQHGLSAGEHGIAVELRADREISFAPDRTAPQLIDDALSVAIQQGATDVHIESYAEDVDLRFRVDGRLRQITTPLSPENVSRVLSRLKVLCEVDMLDHKHPQDGHFGALYKDGDASRRIDFRVSFAPGPHGEDAVVRVFDPERFRLDLDELGMPAEVLERFRRLINRPDGLLLAVGPTASGKTNTLYASVSALRGKGVKIVSCEDPIECEFEKVNQKQISSDVGFATWVRAFLRQNPDVLLVGEIRDPATAETVVQAATTGHMILSTLHTRSAVSAVVRLRALGVPDDYLAHTLVGVVGQRLLARNCTQCLEDYDPDPGLLALYYEDTPDVSFKRGKGCGACYETGFDGLLGVFELLELNRDVAAGIGRGAPGSELLRVATEGGFETLLSPALEAVGRGETTLEEVARAIQPPSAAWE